MAISNYTELQAAIADWLNRDDLAAVVPSFISLAEADINRRLKHWRMETRSTATLDSRFSALPADWGSTISLAMTISGKAYPIRLASVADIADQRSASSGASGRPEVYAITGGQLEIYPTPDAAYSAELVYLANVPSLSATTTSNWLLLDSPDVYLYGALVQSAPYLKDDQRAPIWAGLYQSAIDGLNSSSDEQRYSGSGLRLKNRGF
jgi:hypothetical protein